jgi:hypothetical protein
VRKPEGKIPLGRPRCELWDDNKTDLKRDMMGWTGFIWLKIASSGRFL